TRVSDLRIWKTVAHIAFKFYSAASGTFSTGSTLAVTDGASNASPVRCTALLARDTKHPQDLVPVAAERHTYRAIIDLCSPVLQPDTLQSIQPYVAEVSNIIVDKDMSADLVTDVVLAGAG